MKTFLTYDQEFQKYVIQMKSSGMKVSDICKNAGISTYTLYKIIHPKVNHNYLYEIVANIVQLLINPSQDSETVVQNGTGNAALKPDGNTGERPSTDHSLSDETIHMARMARERTTHILTLNGGHEMCYNLMKA